MEPLPAEVTEVLESMLAAGDGEFSSMRCHVETSRGFWIAVAETAVLVLTIPMVTPKQAKKIWATVEERELEWDIDGLVAVVTEVTGKTWTPVTWN
jgi:hypothetical protein